MHLGKNIYDPLKTFRYRDQLGFFTSSRQLGFEWVYESYKDLEIHLHCFPLHEPRRFKPD